MARRFKQGSGASDEPAPRRRPGAKAPAVGGRVRKNMAMHQGKLTRAQRVLGAANETETVDRALDLVLGRERVRAALERAAEAGGFHGGLGGPD